MELTPEQIKALRKAQFEHRLRQRQIIRLEQKLEHYKNLINFLRSQDEQSKAAQQ